MAMTLKERITGVATSIGEIYRALALARTVVELFGDDVQDYEDRIMEHLADARHSVGLAEAELLALAAVVEDGRGRQD